MFVRYLEKCFVSVEFEYSWELCAPIGSQLKLHATNGAKSQFTAVIEYGSRRIHETLLASSTLQSSLHRGQQLLDSLLGLCPSD